MMELELRNLVARLKKVNLEKDAIEILIEGHYTTKLVEALDGLETTDEVLACVEVIRAMPEMTAKMFLMDRIRARVQELTGVKL